MSNVMNKIPNSKIWTKRIVKKGIRSKIWRPISPKNEGVDNQVDTSQMIDNAFDTTYDLYKLEKRIKDTVM